MKRLLQTIFLLVISFTAFTQNNQTVCNLGFSIKISNNPNWGMNEPVVTDVIPQSPAEMAGLKVNDIILEVNGNGTYLKPLHTVLSWFDVKNNEMSVAIRNFESSFKQMNISKYCKLTNAISETQLAPVFSYLSLEDIQDRRFTIPIRTTVNQEAEFYNYRTFDFAPSDDNSKEFDNRINSIFVKSLTQLGLKQDKSDPDIIIQTFYGFQSNPAFNPESATLARYPENWRFNISNNKMVKIPVYDSQSTVKIEDVMFDLEFGFRLYDRKYTNPGTATMVYECEVKEKINANYSLIDYLEMNLPLIIMKFPNSQNMSSANYHVKLLRFSYTGISYDMNDLRTVVSVATDSPASQAGIKAGDVITKVQGINFNHNAKSITESYRKFISETMKYRDQNTKYTDFNGFTNAMFWDISHYYNISKEISDSKKYKLGFSYLFSHNQYINWEIPKSLTFEIERNGEKHNFEVYPTIVCYPQIFVE